MTKTYSLCKFSRSREVTSSFTLTLIGLLVATPASVSADVRAPGSGRPADELIPRAYLPLVVGGGQAAAAPIIQSFTAAPASIAAGASSTLSWQVTGATSLSISPNVGAVTGTSVTVSPAATTQYTLLATNAAGSVSAQVTVTVVSPPPVVDGFFIVPAPNIELPTSHPTVAVDLAGGVHVVFTPQSAAPGCPARPAYSEYCPANSVSPAAFTILYLGDGVDYASLALDATGRPRVLARKPVQSTFVFQYWQCDGDCLNPPCTISTWDSGVRPALALDAGGNPAIAYDADHRQGGGCGTFTDTKQTRFIRSPNLEAWSR
ncbi:MAG: hypothetical protein QG637_244 [Chloroflexota bacterium]|nr:hypothetical protein [Chloroflexota bacterium]